MKNLFGNEKYGLEVMMCSKDLDITDKIFYIFSAKTHDRTPHR